MEEVRTNDQRCQAIACIHTISYIPPQCSKYGNAFSDYTDIPNQG